MGKLVVMGRDNSVIQGYLEEMKTNIERGKERHEFLQKQIKNLLKEHEEKKAVLWQKIETEIDIKGYLPEGEKAKAQLLEIDMDVMCVKQGDKQGQHPLAGLLGGLIQF